MLRAGPIAAGVLAAGVLALVCALDLIGQRAPAYAPSVASAETLARSDAYLAVNMAPLPEGWRWEERAVPGGFVRVGTAGPEGAPTVLFVPGFTGTAEQYADYYAAWRARGWRVVSLDLPGQGGSVRRAGNPELPWSGDFGRYADAVAPIFTQEAARGPLVVVGESFGGHVTLRALAEGAPDAGSLADAAVLVVPALDANLDGRPRAATLAAAHAATALGLGGRYVAGAGPHEADWAPGAAGGFTGACGDRADRLYGQSALYALRPELRVSGPSWGWLAGMQASGARLARPGALDAVTIPVRMVQSADDRVIENERASAACDQMKDCERFVWDDTSHCLGVEEEAIQERLHGVIAAAVADAVAARGPAS